MSGHGGPEQPRIQTGVLGHSLVSSLVCLHRSLVYSLTSLTPLLVGQCMIGWLFYLCFFPVMAHNAGGMGIVGVGVRGVDNRR